jgi:hypothetical protein
LIIINERQKELEYVPIQNKTIAKKYPTVEGREERINQLYRDHLTEEERKFFLVHDIQKMLVLCNLEFCQKPFKFYESKQIEQHRNTQKHKQGLAQLLVLKEKIPSSLFKDMEKGQIFLVNQLLKCIMCDHSFKSVLESIKFDDSPYRNLVTSVESFTKYLPVVFNYCELGVKNIISNNHITIHHKFVDEEIMSI